ncbi:MAG TPA: hypothetical protein VL285_19125 [Bryobacteraceae bacterium]|nr:hypothetical protein [Bryobacteraceae bacterium]
MVCLLKHETRTQRMLAGEMADVRYRHCPFFQAPEQNATHFKTTMPQPVESFDYGPINLVQDVKRIINLNGLLRETPRAVPFFQNRFGHNLSVIATES